MSAAKKEATWHYGMFDIIDYPNGVLPLPENAIRKPLAGYVNQNIGVARDPAYPYKTWCVWHIPTGGLVSGHYSKLAHAKAYGQRFITILPSEGTFGYLPKLTQAIRDAAGAARDEFYKEYPDA